ncbi:MAG: hypothetical protein ACRC1P_00170 [Cellulosilyticaceae bacterium]
MKEIKLYLKLFYEMNYKFIGLYLAILALVGVLVTGIQFLVFMKEGSYTPEVGDFQMIFPMLVCIFFVGVGYIYKQFETAMHIRADRKSALIALGIIATLSSIAFGIGHYLICNFVQYTSFKIAGLESNTLVLDMTIYQTVIINFLCIMGGTLVGALYNRLSLEKFIPLMITLSCILLLIPGWIIIQDISLLERALIWLWNHPSTMLLTGIICYLSTYLLLRKTTFKNYNNNNLQSNKLQLGKIRIGKM